MIGFLRGSVVERGEESLTLDVGGVGYELTCSANTLDEVSPDLVSGIATERRGGSAKRSSISRPGTSVAKRSRPKPSTGAARATGRSNGTST